MVSFYTTFFTRDYTPEKENIREKNCVNTVNVEVYASFLDFYQREPISFTFYVSFDFVEFRKIIQFDPSLFINDKIYYFIR